MHDPLSTAPYPSLALTGSRAIVPSLGASLAAVAWLLASLATAASIFGLALATSRQSEREAGRMIIAAQASAGYVATLVDALAARQGRPQAR